MIVRDTVGIEIELFTNVYIYIYYSRSKENTMERITFSISFILWRKVSKVPKKGVARCLEPLIHPLEYITDVFSFIIHDGMLATVPSAKENDLTGEKQRSLLFSNPTAEQ